MVLEHDDYKTYLKQVLIERVHKNKGYSLRAFARQLGIAPGMLSEVLNGHKNISMNKALSISERLELSSKEETYFIHLVQLANSKRVEEKERILAKMKALRPDRDQRDLTVEHFKSVANWICVAGITLLDTSKTGLTAKEIGNRLSVTAFEVEEAMDHWVRLDFVQRDEEGRYSKITNHHIMVQSKAPDGALRKFHKSMLEKASTAIDEQSNDEKFVGSETISFDPKDLSEITEIIEEAITKILAKAKKSKNKSEVYYLGFQIFNLTKKRRK